MFVRLLVLASLLGLSARALECLACKDCTGNELKEEMCPNDEQFACGMTLQQPSVHGQWNAAARARHVRRGCVPVARCSDDTDAGKENGKGKSKSNGKSKGKERSKEKGKGRSEEKGKGRSEEKGKGRNKRRTGNNSLTMCCATNRCNDWGLKKELDCDELLQNQTTTTTTTAAPKPECPTQPPREVRLFSCANIILFILAWMLGYLVAVCCGACRLYVADKYRNYRNRKTHDLLE